MTLKIMQDLKKIKIKIPSEIKVVILGGKKSFGKKWSHYRVLVCDNNYHSISVCMLFSFEQAWIMGEYLQSADVYNEKVILWP